MDKIILNKKQKQFLFNNAYVTSKTFDAAVYPNWENYFINNFIWQLSVEPYLGQFRKLVLKDTETLEAFYTTGVNIISTDLATLLTL
jgi:hypothetical protein